MKSSGRIQVHRDGEVVADVSQPTRTVRAQQLSSADVTDISLLGSISVDACIYCGSTTKLSNEHALALALGGTHLIKRGSCEECRRVTHKFETAVLRGPMQLVRFIKNMPSRSRHKDVQRAIPITLMRENGTETINVLTKDAPILLPFPLYRLPGGAGRSQLILDGIANVSFGADSVAFARERGALGIEVSTYKNDAMCFAQLLAKTAFCVAFLQGILPVVEDVSNLVNAFMKDTNEIGRFVGTLDEPFEQRKGVRHKFFMQVMLPQKIVYVNIQLFAEYGAPNYVVILGNLTKNGKVISHVMGAEAAAQLGVQADLA